MNHGGRLLQQMKVHVRLNRAVQLQKQQQQLELLAMPVETEQVSQDFLQGVFPEHKLPERTIWQRFVFGPSRAFIEKLRSA